MKKSILYVIMSKARMMGAGAGGTQYGVMTSVNQGGGDKKQGLVSTTNTRVQLAHHLRVRGGGHNRNLVFCMNQLGGVGRRWGQASGPGNRGGVSLACQAMARWSRINNPPKPCGAQVRGWGSGVKFPPICEVGAAAPAPGPPSTDTCNKWDLDACTTQTACEAKSGEWYEAGENSTCVKKSIRCPGTGPPLPGVASDDCMILRNDNGTTDHAGWKRLVADWMSKTATGAYAMRDTMKQMLWANPNPSPQPHEIRFSGFVYDACGNPVATPRRDLGAEQKCLMTEYFRQPGQSGNSVVVSPLDLAKFWVLATDGMSRDDVYVGCSEVDGGCATCMPGVAVALAESAAFITGLPLQIGDAAWNVNGTALCGKLNPGPKGSSMYNAGCSNGSFWQTSSAVKNAGKSCGTDADCDEGEVCSGRCWWGCNGKPGKCGKPCETSADCPGDQAPFCVMPPGQKCTAHDVSLCVAADKDNPDAACEPCTGDQAAPGMICGDCLTCRKPEVNCSPQINPLCNAATVFEFTNTENQECPGSYSNPPTCPPPVYEGEMANAQCTAESMACGVYPHCILGVVALTSCGWGTAACSYIYRQAAANTALPYGRLAIQACRVAKKQLLSYGWTPGDGKTCDMETGDLAKLFLDVSPVEPGNWDQPVTPHCQDGARNCPCMCGDTPCSEAAPRKASCADHPTKPT